MEDLRNRYARVCEVSHYLGITPAWVMKLIKAEKLKADIGPHGYLIYRDDMERLAAERRANPPRPGRKAKGCD